MITKEEVNRLLEYRDGRLFWKIGRRNASSAGTEAGYVRPSGYREVKILGKSHKTHRLIWLICKGEHPRYTIDHIDGDPLNNNIDNLRDVSLVENCKNRGLDPKNKSGYSGVWWYEQYKVWAVTVGHKGQNIYLGQDTDFENAVMLAMGARAQLGYHENHGRPHKTKRYGQEGGDRE